MPRPKPLPAARPARPAARQLRAASRAVAASIRPRAAARPERSRVRPYFERLPQRDQRAMKQLLGNPRLRASVPLQRAVAAVMVLRGLKGGQRLTVSLADLQMMSNSPSWTPRRLANLATVLRRAVAIAAAEGIGANAAFQKALKAYGLDKKFNKQVCGA